MTSIDAGRSETPGTDPARPPAPRRSTGSRVLLAAGALLIVGGLVLLGWVGWQFTGSNWVAARQQAEVVDTLERQWERQPADRRKERTATEYGDAMGIIRVPRFGDDYAIPLMETVDYDVLRVGFGHFEDSAPPGGVGNFAVAAHRTTRNEPLRHMPDLVPGDKVYVETAKATYVYEMTTGGDDLEVTFTDTWVVDPKPVNPDPQGVNPPDHDRIITLTTCAELFSTDDRLVAFGKLVKVQPRTAAG